MNWYWHYSIKERWHLYRSNEWGYYYCSIWCVITDRKFCGGRPTHRRRK